MRGALTTAAIAFAEHTGEGAFCGPKVDLHVRDVLGRRWQMGRTARGPTETCRSGSRSWGTFSGPELPEDDLAGLLEPFRRAAQQRVGTGNGLGLSIVRTIVTAHNGQLALHALPDGGLRVTVTLPSRDEQPDDGAAARPPVAHSRR